MPEIKIAKRLYEPEITRAYELYQRAFRAIAKRAIMLHIMDSDHFYDVCAETYFEKHMLYDDAGDLIGMGTLTNTLSAELTISRDYFLHHHRAEFEADKVFYVGFIFPIRPDPLFDMILRSMTAGRKDNGEQFFMDFCGFNENAGLPGTSEQLLRADDDRLVFDRVDWQGYWRASWPRKGTA